MKKTVLLSMALVLPFFGLATNAHAANPTEEAAVKAVVNRVTCDHPGNASADVDVRASTLGVGLEVAVPLNECVAFRVGVNRFTRSFNTSTGSANSQVNYNGNLKLSSGELLLDWHPFEGIAHLTAGVLYNDNKFDLNSVGPFTVNGVQYNAGTVSAKVTFNKAAPYLGFGWSGQAKKQGWSIKSDFGVLFQGSPKATLSASDPAVAANLAAEQAILNDKLKNYKYYPVLSIGIGYAY